MSNNDAKSGDSGVINDKKINHYLISSTLTTLAGLISFPILTRLLSKADYGIYSLIQAAQLFYEALLKSGFQFSIVRHYAANRDGNRRVFLKSLLLFPASVSLSITVFLSLLIVILSYLGVIDILFSLVIISAQGSIFVSLFRSYMQATGRSKFDSLIDIINKYTYLILVIPFVLYVSSNYWGVITAICLASVLCAIISIWLNREVFQSISSKIDWKLIRESYKYSFPLILTEITILSIAYVDRFIMAAMDVDFSDIGIYAIGFGLANVIYMFLWKTIQPSVFPSANEIHDQLGVSYSVAFLERNANFLFLVFICLTVGVFLNSEDFIILICGEDKSDAAVIFEFAIILFLMKTLSNILFYGFHLNQKTKSVFISEITVAVTNIIINIVMIPIWGMYGALIATFIAFILGLCIKYYLLEESYRIKNFFSGSLYVILLMLIYIVFHELVVNEYINGGVYRLLISIVIFLIIIFSRYKFWMNKFSLAFKNNEFI